MNEIKKDGLVFTDRINPITEEVLKTAEEVYKEWLDDKDKQIDICPEPKPKTLEELTKENEQLWETVQFLLKKTGMIGDDEDATT